MTFDGKRWRLYEMVRIGDSWHLKGLPPSYRDRTINDACTITDMTRAKRIVVYRQMLEDLNAVNAIRKAQGLDDLEPPT